MVMSCGQDGGRVSKSSTSRALGPEFSQGWGAGPGSPQGTGG